MMLQLPIIPYFISARGQILFPSPIWVLQTQDFIPKTLKLPIRITLSFYVGLNIITALSSMMLQSPKIILKFSSFFSQIIEQVGLIIHPSPKVIFPTIQLSPKFIKLFLLFINYKSNLKNKMILFYLLILAFMISYKLLLFIICKYEKLGHSFEGKKIEAIETLKVRAQIVRVAIIRTRVPIMLNFSKEKKWKQLKQFMLVTIESRASLQLLAQVIEAKLIWAGYLDQRNRTLYFYVKQKQIVLNSMAINQLYRDNQGEDEWLELTLRTDNPFGGCRIF